MIFEMNLHPLPFMKIKNSLKDIEMRLYKGNRKDISVGDSIRFTNIETKETLLVKVTNIYVFKTFKELYDYFPKNRLGYLDNEIANYKDMNIYYSDEEIKKYGVVGFEIIKI